MRDDLDGIIKITSALLSLLAYDMEASKLMCELPDKYAHELSMIYPNGQPRLVITFGRFQVIPGDMRHIQIMRDLNAILERKWARLSLRAQP
jgi:hypothetical protein